MDVFILIFLKCNLMNNQKQDIEKDKSEKKKEKGKEKKKKKDNISKDKKKEDTKDTKNEIIIHPEYDLEWRHIGKRCKFSQKHFDRYDIPARRVVKEVFGKYIKDNPDKYGPDMIITHPDCKYKFLEIQVCASWKDEYPFKTVFLYSRKMRYGEDTLFLTLDNNLLRGYLFNNKMIDRKKPRRLKKWSRIFVYDVPWCSVSEIILMVFKKTVGFSLKLLS